MVLGVRRVGAVAITAATLGLASVTAPAAHADNSRLNKGVYSNIYTAQRQNGCTTPTRLDAALTEAARRHTLDSIDHPDINGDSGSDGSTPQLRAQDAGYHGDVGETVAINPALAISGIEILNQWWNDPPSRAIMQDCRYTDIGVWSENRLDRSVVVAVYGAPRQ